MKRPLVLLACALFFVQPLFSFDTNRHAGNRITVLAAPHYDRSADEDRVARRIRERLVRELRERGFDAQDGGISYDEMQRRGTSESGLLVELAPADSSERSIADASVRVPSGVVDISVVVSRIAAELRVYDGRSLELVAKRHLHSQAASVVPTGAGVGSRTISIFLGLPIDYARYRAAINGVADDAANEISNLRR
jgi:hypothetical protein